MNVTRGLLINTIQGHIPLVIDVHSADAMASLVVLKRDAENILGSSMKWTFTGATEAHILAEDIGLAGIGVIVNPVRPFPYTWDTRRM